VNLAGESAIFRQVWDGHSRGWSSSGEVGQGLPGEKGCFRGQFSHPTGGGGRPFGTKRRGEDDHFLYDPWPSPTGWRACLTRRGGGYQPSSLPASAARDGISSPGGIGLPAADGQGESAGRP
jgi:hypothetical protein